MTIGSFNSIGTRTYGAAAAEVPLFDTFATMAKAHEPVGGLKAVITNNLTGGTTNENAFG